MQISVVLLKLPKRCKRKALYNKNNTYIAAKFIYKMRTVAELPHPDFKITIFNMNQRYIIKFEQGAIEQTYKISEMDIVEGVNGIFELIDETFLNTINETFKQMRNSFNEAYNRYEV